MLKKVLDKRPDLCGYLFIRGFLVSDKKVENLDRFPFYGNWNETEKDGYYFYTHKKAAVHFASDNGVTLFVLGHCYDPFLMEIDEAKILADILKDAGTDKYYDRISEITGVYVTGAIENGKLRFSVDPSGMQSACYGVIDGHFYLSSHPQLIGDICSLEMDDFVKELIRYKWYGRVMGPYLPADLTPFAAVKRIVPSIDYTYADGKLAHKRFWPLVPFEVAEGEEYDRVIKEAADILKKNMELISKKWQHPWISLTGGIDSNTTFAAAEGIYDKFETFSYLSAPKEVPDVEAAKTISEAFGLKHHVYEIPETPDAIADYDIKVEIQRHNSGYVAERKGNESRKRFYLEENCGCDVEVKSWVSETIRAYWYKHYGRKSMPKLSAKLFRNLYKIFLANRSLAHKVDKLFDSYIRAFEYDKIPACYPPADMHYNEVTWGSWGGMNISEMKYCFDITFAYNNRKFLDLLFRVPLEKRISDQHHLDMKKYLNPKLYDMHIRVVNMKETDTRARLLNIIFTVNSFLPF